MNLYYTLFPLWLPRLKEEKYIEVRKFLQNLVLQLKYRSSGSLNVKFNYSALIFLTCFLAYQVNIQIYGGLYEFMVLLVECEYQICNVDIV